MAVPVVESVSTNSVAAAASITITKPTGTVSGNLLSAFVTVRTAASVNTPSGWTAAGSVTDGFSDTYTNHFWKIAGGSEPSDYTFTPAFGTNDITGGIVRISGHDAATPMDATPTTASQTSGTTPTSPSITTVTNDCLILRVCGGDTPFSAIPAGHTSQWDTDAGAGLAIQRLVTISQPTAGATGTATFTYPYGNTATLITVAIRPTSAGGAAKPVLFHSHYQNQGWR